VWERSLKRSHTSLKIPSRLVHFFSWNAAWLVVDVSGRLGVAWVKVTHVRRKSPWSICQTRCFRHSKQIRKHTPLGVYFPKVDVSSICWSSAFDRDKSFRKGLISTNLWFSAIFDPCVSVHCFKQWIGMWHWLSKGSSKKWVFVRSGNYGSYG